MQLSGNHPRQALPQRRRAAFTLIETALATIIVGVGIVAAFRLFVACSMQNRTAADMTTAMLLASNVREAMTGLSFRDPYTGTTTFGPETGETLATYNDVDDFDGRSFSPPIDSLRATIPSMSQYTQFVAVMPIYPNKLNANTNETSPEITPKSTYTGAARVRVRILFSANATETPAEVYRANWERVDN